METIEFQQLMAAYNTKLDELLQLNKESVLKRIQIKKARKKTSSLMVYSILELLFFGFIVFFIGDFLAKNWNLAHFAVSGLIVLIFAIIALTGSIGQLVLISQIDYSGSILEIRKKIERVNVHGFLFLKLVFLSIPVWWAYTIVGIYLISGLDIYPHLAPDFVIRYLIFNLLLTIPLIWVMLKLSHKNLHILWVRKTIDFFTSSKTKKALDFLKEIENFERQDIA